MDRKAIIENIRDALPAEKHGIKLTIVDSSERPDIEVSDRRTNEQAVLFFMSDVLNDLDAIHAKHPGKYKEYAVAIDSVRPNFIRYGKKVYMVL